LSEEGAKLLDPAGQLAENSTLAEIKKELKWNDIYYRLTKGY
jgi:L-arabinose isomerase